MMDEEEEVLHQRLVDVCGGNKEEPKSSFCAQLYYCIFGKK
jgi:hypothetical protein